MNASWLSGARRSSRALFCFAVVTTLVPQLHAKYVGAEAPNPCETCSGPPSCAVGEGSFSLSEGNLSDQVPVTQVSSGFGPTLEFNVTCNTYNADGSRAALDAGLGFGWTHTYNVFLFVQVGSLFRWDGEGRVTRYALGPGGTYTSGNGWFESLVRNPDGSYTLTQGNGTIWRFALVPGTPFQVGGPVYRLTHLTDRTGNVVTLTYESGLLTRITDTFGRSLILAYNAAKHLISLRDPLSHVTTFHYDSTGRRLIRITDPLGRSVLYTYNSQNQITRKQDKDGRVFTYQYQSLKPVSVRDGNGSPMVRLANGIQWATDAAILARQQLRVYLPTTTIRTDGAGNPWRYSYDANGYVTRIVAPDGATTVYTYDPATLRLGSMTDANGHQTTYTYDGRGNRTGVADHLGNTTSYTYEPLFNQLTSVTDPNGRITTYDYDPVGNRIRETQAAGLSEERTRIWTYDSHGNVLTSTDWRGATTQYTYDANGNLSSQTDAVGEPEQRTTLFTYDPQGNLVSSTDALLRVTQYSYDALDRLIRITDPAGRITLYQYDAQGNKVAETDRNGHTTRFVYDARARLIRTTNALGQVEFQTYNADDRRTSLTDRNGHQTHYSYDLQGRLSRVTDDLGGVTRSEYDGVGNLVRLIDPLGRVTAYTYDALNRPVQTTAPDGGVTMLEYATGAAPCCTPTLGSPLVIRRIDALGHVTCYAYDSLDRLTREVRKQTDTDCAVTDADDALTQYAYDPNDNRIRVIEPNGTTSEFLYDTLDRLVRTTNGEGEITEYAYDAVGNRVQMTTPNLNLVQYTYDALDRLGSIVDSEGPVRSYTYDAEGNRLTETDGEGQTTTSEYDALDRVVRVIDAAGESTVFAYDPVGNLLERTDREGVVTRYVYDAVNQLVRQTEAVGTPVERTTETAYDAVGNVVRITDAHGHTTEYGYDPADRRVRETFPDPVPNTRIYAYDTLGNLLSRTDPQGQTTTYDYTDLDFLATRNYPTGPDDHFTYDLAGRMLTAERGGWLVEFEYDGANRVVRTVQEGRELLYTYDTLARTRELEYPGGYTTTDHYDFRNRLERTEDGGGPPLVEYIYDAADRVVSRTSRNGVVGSHAYDAVGRLVSLDHTFGGGTLAGFSYGYDREGNPHCEVHDPNAARSEAYQYDELYRLIDYRVGAPVNCEVPAPSTESIWDLDLLSNWRSRITDGTAENRTHNEANEILTIDAAPLFHDPNGNLIADPFHTYEYDEENRLVRVTRLADSRVVGEYAYDALGRRVARLIDPDLGPPNPSMTFFFHDDAREIEEQDGGGLTAATYAYGGGLDEVVQMIRGGAALYYHANGLGSVAALTDAGGTVVERAAYDAYGGAAIADGSFTPAPANAWGTPHSVAGNPFHFTGRRLDEESGLMHYRARTYDTHKGRFLQRDPFLYAQGLNLYEYARSNPARYTDPYGTLPIPPLLLPGVSDRIVDDLIKDLDSDKFVTRQRAQEALTVLAILDGSGRVRARLQRALDNRPPLEVRRRIEHIFEAIHRAETDAFKRRVCPAFDCLQAADATVRQQAERDVLNLFLRNPRSDFFKVLLTKLQEARRHRNLGVRNSAEQVFRDLRIACNRIKNALEDYYLGLGFTPQQVENMFGNFCDHIRRE